MTLDIINKELNNFIFVENIRSIDENIFRGKSYENLFECEIVLSESNRIVIVIGIPFNWELDLIDIYVADFNALAFIPHIDNTGKLCLFETEGVLIDWNLNGILCQSVLRARDVLKDGLAGENKMEFINEFESYWCQLPEARLAYFSVPVTDDVSKIKFSMDIIEKKKKETSREHQKRMNLARIYVGKDVDSIEQWSSSNLTIMNAAYFVINAEEDVFPPDIREALSVDYLNLLLKMVPYKDAKKALCRLKRQKVIMFAIKQPIGMINYIGFYLLGGELQEDLGTCIFSNIDKIQPLVVSRTDKQYLLKRTMELDIDNAKKKILVVGCGSIGGYLICELARAGYEDITIVDNDTFREENIFRHILGREYISEYKCVAIADYIKKNIPDVHIKTLPEKFERIILEGDLDIGDFDVIVSATGNQNLNRWINKFVMTNKVQVPVIYAWNEVYGIGNHVAYFKCGYEGCYECIFGRNENSGEIYNKSSYCAPGQIVTKTAGSCGKTYIPYGNMISLKTVVICMDLVKASLENKINRNILVSLKGDDDYFIRQGLMTSNRYKNQKEDAKELSGDEFVNKNCGVCNGNSK